MAEYIVRAGDNLSKIAADFHVTVSELQSYNCMANPHKLKIGQKISIPQKQGIAVSSYTAVSNPSWISSYQLAEDMYYLAQGYSGER